MIRRVRLVEDEEGWPSQPSNAAIIQRGQEASTDLLVAVSRSVAAIFRAAPAARLDGCGA